MRAEEFFDVTTELSRTTIFRTIPLGLMCRLYLPAHLLCGYWNAAQEVCMSVVPVEESVAEP